MCRPFGGVPRVPKGYEIRVHIHDTNDGIMCFCGDTCGAPLFVKTNSFQVLHRDRRTA